MSEIQVNMYTLVAKLKHDSIYRLRSPEELQQIIYKDYLLSLPPSTINKEMIPKIQADMALLIPKPPKPTKPTTNFSVLKLPYELRQIIYKDYILSLPAITIDKETATWPLHRRNHLYHSSRFFAKDIPITTFYQHANFEFSSGADMKEFSQHYGRATSVQKIRIFYARDPSPTRDWVYFMNSCFENLVDITFTVGRKSRGIETGICWDCVKEACYEGVELNYASKGRKMTSRDLKLRIEDEDGKEICSCLGCR